jgi:hypothetical protein
MRRTAILMAAIVILAACASAATSDAGAGSDADAGFVLAGGEAAQLRTANLQVALVTGRKVIRTARLELQAGDTRAVYAAIGDLVDSAGGFVAKADVHPVTGESAQPDITMTVRVPTDRLGEVLEGIKGTADRVVSESQDSQDVSEQFVDLEARITNLRALEVELRALLEEVRGQADSDPEKLLRVFQELASVRGQIEQLQGQLDRLGGLTDLATVDVAISQTPTSGPIVEQAWTPAETFREAARGLVDVLRVVADGAITLFVLVLPIATLMLAAPAAIGWSIYRRRRSRPTAAPQAIGD